MEFKKNESETNAPATTLEDSLDKVSTCEEVQGEEVQRSRRTGKSKPRRKTVSTSLASGKTKPSTRLFSDDEEDMITPIESPLLNPIVSSISNKPAEQSLHKAGMRSRRSHSLSSTLYAETPLYLWCAFYPGLELISKQHP